jgi:hypothetical protein
VDPIRPCVVAAAPKFPNYHVRKFAEVEVDGADIDMSHYRYSAIIDGLDSAEDFVRRFGNLDSLVSQDL